MLRITVAWAQHATGTGTSIFNDIRELPHIEAKWIEGIRRFLRHINATIETDEVFIPETQREREQRIIAERKELHKAVPPSGAAGGGNDTYELKQTIIKALKTDIKRNHPSAENLMNQKTVKKLSKGRSITTTEPRELFHPIMIEMDLRDSLKDDDEIIFQLDIGEHNGYSIPKSFLRDFLTKKKYLNHTKYQCMGTGEHALMITENNIVFEHNNRSFFQFVNGSGLGIPLGLFLRQQLLDALNAKEKYFLIHVHQNTDINPIVSADEVQWYAPPVLNSTTTHFSVEGEQITNWAEPIPDIPSNQFIVQEDSDFRGYDETHTQLTTNVSADHCQPSNGSKRHLLTIRPVNKEILKFIKHKLLPSRKRKRRGGRRKTKKKKSKKNKRKKSRRRRKQKGGDDEEPIPFEQLVDGETYDVTFSEDFVNDDNNAPMSINMTNVLFEKMPAHQEGYFKLTFLHQKDGEKEENILYEGNEYGKGKTVYAKRKSGRAGVSPDGGGRRKTKRKKKKRKKKKGKKSRRKR